MKPIDIWVGESKRSRTLCGVLAQYFTRAGVPFCMVEAEKYVAPIHEIAVFYGLANKLRQIYRDYRRNGLTTILMDLGYWGRLEGGRLAGYHRIAVNGLHATDYFQKVRHTEDRATRLGLQIKPHRAASNDSPVLVCGQSSKASWVYDLAPLEWETQIVGRLCEMTNRPIWFRPKPNQESGITISGAHLVPVTASLESVLGKNIWAVVTHHSNSAIDALVEGVPVFVVDGIAAALAAPDFWHIEAPRYASDADRWQFLCDAAYVQWKVAEIESGAMWRHLQQEELVP